MLDLTPIEKRLAGISSWPWRVPSASMFVFDAEGRAIGSAIPSPYPGCSGKNNADFFGFAPEIISDLIAEIKRLRKEVALLDNDLRETVGYV